MTSEPAARVAIVACARELERLGLNHGTSGNIGVRIGGGVLVTPTGIPPHALRPADVVRLAPDGVPDPGQRVPTSEWRMHVDIFAARPDVGAIVHTHSPEATAAACLRQPLPAVHYAVARAGGPTVPCARYATYGTPELSASVLAALGPEGNACLMANHGMLAVGPDLVAATALAVEVEWLARVVRLTRSHAAEPHVLPDGEIGRVMDRLGTYGQPG
ncbi:MAG TPA: class II aldolase/adducin family protein [Acidimicrobiales bacterium]|jgi:L-fuculose-phosphate aldolase|nr:class II aldolase/adducin family protein [Acidimicrobiales bacterium]